MGDAPTTRPSLLVRLRNPRDGQAWSQFVDVYAPLVYAFALGQSLQDADAADLTQEVLRAVSAALGRFEYDPERGSFRGWLFTVVRSKLSNFRAARARQFQGTGDTNVRHVLEQQPERGQEHENSWDQEYDRQLFNQAAALVRQTVQEPTWHAFWQTAVEGKSAKQVAGELKMTVASVYLAKSRVMARLREQVQQLAGS
jgi:RNA polymerase sigma factor (sigma-70 family)